MASVGPTPVARGDQRERDRTAVTVSFRKWKLERIGKDWSRNSVHFI